MSSLSKIKILDGAMGSEIICHGETLPKYIWSAQTNLNNPELVYKIHKNYIEKGADYITTNTFRTTPRAFKKTGLNEQEAIDAAHKSFQSAIVMAKKAADETKILGSIAPLEDCYQPELFPGIKVAKKEFEEIGALFYKSNIDCFILETMNSIIETKTCIEAIRQFKIPIWVSFNLLNSHQIQSGESLKDAICEMKKYPIDCLLINCNPLDRTYQALDIIATHWDRAWGIYPNLGIGEPSPDGVIKEYYSNDEFLKLINKAANLGAHIIGGCCGSNPNHIDLIKRIRVRIL